jgi:hypothetical protein
MRGKAEFEHVREMPLGKESGFGGDEVHAAEQIQVLPDYRASAV